MARLVSVVIPCFKQARFLGEAVRSALGQDYPAREVVVVNDGSPDNTREVASAFGSAITYVEQENKGLSAARNVGVRAARGEYIALLDSDDVCLPGRLATQARYLDEHPEVGMVVSDAVLYDGSCAFGLKSRVSGRPRRRDNFRWETVEYCATPSTALIRRRCFEEVGYFDERLRGGGEDWLFAVQLTARYDLAYLDFPTILYRVHPESATRNTDLINDMNRRACGAAITSKWFGLYPAHFRAKLLYYRFATAWRVEPKGVALRYLLRALATDPTQLPYGVHVIRQGLTNALDRRRGQ